MTATRNPETLIDRHGGELARFFLLLLNDPLDAEDCFHNLFLRLLGPRGGPFDEAKAYRAAVGLARGVRARRERARYRPVEVGEREEGKPLAARRRAWRSLSLSDRAAVLLLLEGERDAGSIAEILRWKPDSLSSRIERALLVFRAAAAGVTGRVPPARLVPRGSLVDLRFGAPGKERRREIEEAVRRSPTLGKAQAELDEAVGLVLGLGRAALRASDWKRMRRRLLREPPARSAVLLWDRFPSPLGTITAALLDGSVVRLAFGSGGEKGWSEAGAGVPAGEFRRDPEALAPARRQLEEYFAGKRKSFTFSRRLVGVTAFQAAVLDACARVPFGSVRSYKQIARDVGKPQGMRAVGRALSRNPLPIVIPCHRIISHTGRIGGFSGGVARKEKLLALEGMAGLFTGDGE